MTSPSLLFVFTVFYQTQSYHPIILDSDLMKNFLVFILALNDIVHLCSTYFIYNDIVHASTIRTEYTMTGHIT